MMKLGKKKGLYGNKIRIEPLNLGGGIAKDGTTIFDPHHTIPVKLKDGRVISPLKYTNIHEQTEWAEIKKYEDEHPMKEGETIMEFDARMYIYCHEQAQKAEAAALKADGIDPDEYEKAIDPGIDKAAAQPASVNPPDLIPEHKSIAKLVEDVFGPKKGKKKGVGKINKKLDEELPW